MTVCTFGQLAVRIQPFMPHWNSRRWYCITFILIPKQFLELPMSMWMRCLNNKIHTFTPEIIHFCCLVLSEFVHQTHVIAWRWTHVCCRFQHNQFHYEFNFGNFHRQFMRCVPYSVFVLADVSFTSPVEQFGCEIMWVFVMLSKQRVKANLTRSMARNRLYLCHEPCSVSSEYFFKLKSNIPWMLELGTRLAYCVKYRLMLADFWTTSFWLAIVWFCWLNN